MADWIARRVAPLPERAHRPGQGTRVLRVNEDEAQTVRCIYARYLGQGSVHALQHDLAASGIVSKRWTTSKGRIVGGVPFNRGALFHLLRNPIYIGRISHKGEVHEGQHEEIVDEELFARVQRSLDGHMPERRSASEAPRAKCHLTGKLFDAEGEVMTPVCTRNRHGKLYRYYVSASLQQGGKPRDDGILRRISASDLEAAVKAIVERWLPNINNPLAELLEVHISNDGLLIDMPPSAAKDVATKREVTETIIHSGPGIVRIRVPLHLPLRGGRRFVIAGSQPPGRPDPALIAALRKAHAMLSWERGRPSVDGSPRSKYERKILRLALLAPDLQRDILAGHQPPTLNLEVLKQIEIPICWAKQRDALGST